MKTVAVGEYAVGGPPYNSILFSTPGKNRRDANIESVLCASANGKFEPMQNKQFDLLLDKLRPIVEPELAS